ncbi:hypothetical protein PEV8663_03079 [Pelagimonas varians]|uniref:Uncharacterized protein n=1 Tax=Pelagimonas varians TaxID=696760 RepID=A0A238KS53_9RHOB|nr:hypothetical protein PEV8663_03079 [Pelagimonas varians]
MVDNIGVVAVAADQRVGVLSAVKAVIASVAIQIICPDTAVETIVPRAAEQSVIPQGPAQRVVAAQTQKGVVAIIADQSISQRRAFDFFDTGIGVASRVAANLCRQCQIDRNRNSAAAIGGPVPSSAADQCIRTAKAFERVVSTGSDQGLV